MGSTGSPFRSYETPRSSRQPGITIAGYGGFVGRVAHPPHYDDVKRSATEPAVIGILGLAPVDLKLVDPSSLAWRHA
jgi:hypothetical protein